MSKAKAEGEARVGTAAEPLDAIDSLWRVVGRYDQYIGSTNTKAAMLVAFNTFVPGSVVLKWKEVGDAFGPTHRGEFVLASVAALVALVAAILSLVHTFLAFRPYLGSPKEPALYHSDIFFEDVAEQPTEKEFLRRVAGWSEEGLRRDLAYQAYALSKGLRIKFAHLIRATNAILYWQLPALGVVIALLLYAVGGDALRRVAGS